MERLTKWVKCKHKTFFKAIPVDTDRVTKQRYIKRLAEYEDLGYTPQELQKIVNACFVGEHKQSDFAGDGSQ